jgi:hypothetical protein
VALTLEDRVEIQELIARYCWATDTGDAEARAATFTPNAVFDGWIGILEGRAAIADQIASGWRKAIVSGQVGSRGRLQHWVTNLFIEGDGQRATARCYFVLIQGQRDEAHMTGMGQYRNDLVKTEDGWLFEKMTVADWPGPEVLARLGQK